jgi:ribonucleotide reductase alpha subunit
MSVNILSDEFLSKYKNKQPNWGFNDLGYIVYKRTYARNKPDGTKEEWWETVARCIEGAQKIGAGYTQKEAERLYDLVFNLKCNFAGRMLWQLGTETVDRFGANSLLNCWYVSIKEPEDFLFIFENLMLGGGVGFSVRREDIHELPRVKEGVEISHNKRADADFIVPDSREGWVELLRKVLDSYFVTGKSFTYSTILVRGKGEPINGFGGTASGPQILVDGIEQICSILEKREKKKVRSIDVLDICNIIGSVVVAGNVRR